MSLDIVWKNAVLDLQKRCKLLELAVADRGNENLALSRELRQHRDSIAELQQYIHICDTEENWVKAKYPIQLPAEQTEAELATEWEAMPRIKLTKYRNGKPVEQTPAEQIETVETVIDEMQRAKREFPAEQDKPKCKTCGGKGKVATDKAMIHDLAYYGSEKPCPDPCHAKPKECKNCKKMDDEDCLRPLDESCDDNYSAFEPKEPAKPKMQFDLNKTIFGRKEIADD